MTIKEEVTNMALKNLYEMAKADRYTADGREAIIKAQEAETEDKVYQIGEISQKTGLQKTANGWVKPKSGKQPESKPAEPETLAKVSHDNLDVARNEMNTTPEEDQMLDYFVTEMHEDGTSLDEIIKRQDGIYERSNGAYPKEEKTYKSLREKIMNHYGSETKTNRNEEGRRNFKAALDDNPTSGYDFAKTVEFAAPMSQEDKVELKKLRLFMSDEGADYKQALRSRASNLVDGNKSNGDWFPEKEKSIMKIAKAVGYDKELHKFIEEEYKGYDLGYSEDAAPRTLTGDTRIRVRKA